MVVEPRDGPAYRIEIEHPQLVVAGYTGRNSEAVDLHIRELADHGVEPPPSVPMFWHLPDWLLLSDGRTVQVAGASTSGEAEAVLVRLTDGSLIVTVGSDHTDRDLERRSLELSKIVCPKVMGAKAWLFEDVAEGWDQLQLDSSTGAVASYQLGKLELIRRPLEVLALADKLVPDPHRPLVLFLGTVSLNVAEFSFDSQFVAALRNPVDGRMLTCMYAVENIGAGGEPLASGVDHPEVSSHDAFGSESPGEVVQENKPRE